MPELPEVETVRRGLATVLEGRRLARVQAFRPDLRLPLPEDFAQMLTGRRVRSVGRRAKYLVISVEDGPVLLGHLGMSGRVVIAPAHDDPPRKHDHVRFLTEDGMLVTYTDPRRFGLFVFAPAADPQSHPLLAGLGPEPLDDAFTPAVLTRAFKEKITPVKVALLDQRIVAGIGNIYASEALFRAGIAPMRAAGSLTSREAEALVPAIKSVLGEAIAAGGSSLRDHVQPSGELGYFQHRFAVYDREGEACPGCDCDRSRTGGVRRLAQSGRSTFYCSHRQR